MQNSLLHGFWTQMCVGSVCTQPPYGAFLHKPKF